MKSNYKFRGPGPTGRRTCVRRDGLLRRGAKGRGGAAGLDLAFGDV